jgi:hypothetical protein
MQSQRQCPAGCRRLLYQDCVSSIDRQWPDVDRRAAIPVATGEPTRGRECPGGQRRAIGIQHDDIGALDGAVGATRLAHQQRQILSLAEAVDLELYSRGAAGAKPIVLTAQERAEVIEFLQALSGGS